MISKRAPFWERVNAFTKVNADGCHVFCGTLNQDGYGRIGKDNKYVFVHREVWKKHNGEIPQGMCVCHHCDNPSCINPAHLFIGTHTDNMRDRANKGRYKAKGESNNSAKLTQEDVSDIRVLLSYGMSYAEVGRNFGVTDVAVRNIKVNRTWCN